MGLLSLFVYLFCASLVIGASFLLYIILRYDVTVTLDYKRCHYCSENR